MINHINPIKPMINLDDYNDNEEINIQFFSDKDPTENIDDIIRFRNEKIINEITKGFRFGLIYGFLLNVCIMTSQFLFTLLIILLNGLTWIKISTSVLVGVISFC